MYLSTVLKYNVFKYSPSMSKSIDDLSGKVTELGTGCHIGGAPSNDVAYADCLALVAPTARAINELLRMCDHFFQWALYCVYSYQITVWWGLLKPVSLNLLRMCI